MTLTDKARRNRIVALIRLRMAASQPARPTAPVFRSRRPLAMQHPAALPLARLAA